MDATLGMDVGSRGGGSGRKAGKKGKRRQGFGRDVCCAHVFHFQFIFLDNVSLLLTFAFRSSSYICFVAVVQNSLDSPRITLH